MRWEYRTIHFEPGGFLGGKLDFEAFDARLNQLGSEGWELVGTFDTNQGQGATRYVVATFKRPRG